MSKVDLTPEEKRAAKNEYERKRRAAKKAETAEAQVVVVEAPPVIQLPPAPDVPVAADVNQSIKNVMENGVIIILRFSRLQTKRSLGADAVEVDADKSMLHVAKDILDSEELRAIVSYDSSTAMWFRNRCTPAPWVRGFLISSALLGEAFVWLDFRKAGRVALVEKLKAAYPRLVADAQVRLKELFDPTQYPAVDTLAEAFTMEYLPIEFNVSRKTGSVVSQAAFAEQSKKLEASMASAAKTIDQTLAFGLQEIVAGLTDALSSADMEGKPKRVHPATLAKLEAFAEIFPKRNITGNQELAELVRRAASVTAGVDTKALKSVGDTRAKVLTEMTSVRESLDKMLVDAPKRRMSLEGEEV